MTDNQEAFCWEYISNGYNALEAYRTTHPDCTIGSARNGSWRYMKHPEIRVKLQELIADIFEEKNISAETIASELATVAFQRREILGLDYNEGTKLKALELLQKQLGLQTTNQKVEAEVKQVMIVEDLDE